MQELQGEGEGEETDCGELLVVPARSLQEVSGSGGGCGDEQNGDDWVGGASADVEADGGQDEEFDGGPGELGKREVADSPVGIAEKGQDLGEVGGGEEEDGSEIGEGGEKKEGGFEQAGSVGGIPLIAVRLR